MIQKIKLTTCLLLAYSLVLKAQVNHTLYFMDRIPQSNQLNPAIQPNCNVYVGVPGLSSLYIDVGNSSLNVKSVLQYNSTLDSVITFLHPLADRNIFFNALKDKNNIFDAFQYDLLSFGFRVRSLYFHFNSAIKNYSFITYPKSLANLLIKGSPLGTITDLKTLGLQSSTYVETSLGLSNKFDNDLTLGAKFKLLNGLININTVNNSFNIETYEDANSRFINQVSADVSLRMYAPMLKKNTNSNDIPVDSLFAFEDEPFNNVKPFESLGLGFDVGMVYSGFENILLSASIIDLGFISWRNNSYEYKMRSSYTLGDKIIDIDSLENAFENNFGEIKDSITFSRFTKSYTTSLPTKLYLGGEYFLETYFSFGLMSVSHFYKNAFYQQFTFSANFRPLRASMLSVNYSFLNNGFNYLGLGLSFRILPPLQFHLLMDNIPLRYGRNYIPIYAKKFNLRFGLNFTFGYSQRIKDKPFSWE